MKIGDKVVFSLGREKGVVVAFHKNGKVEVEMEIGMNVFVDKSEIAVDFSSPEMHSKPIKTNRFYIDKTSPQKAKNVSKSIDLHITSTKIIELNHGKVLSVQLDLLSLGINNALLEGVKEMIVIHGVGEGILKRSVHEYLKSHRLVKSFSEADPRKYGKGATKVFF